MKSNVMPSIVQIEANELRQLVTEVRETVAAGIIGKTHTNEYTKFWYC